MHRLVAPVAAASLMTVRHATTEQGTQADPLRSWNDGAARRAIIAFVGRVTKQGGPDFVPVPERIATFDNDGTLWSEKPVPFQIVFAFDRVKALAPQHPEWKTKEPFASLLKGEMGGVAATGEKRRARDHHRDAHRDDYRRILPERSGVDHHRASSEDRPTVHRNGVSADARAARLSARERIQDVHRVRRRRGIHAAVSMRQDWKSVFPAVVK